MSRRRRAAGLALLAGIAALLAGTIVDGYGSSLALSYGPLRPVVVARAELLQGEPIGAATAAAGLELRRIPDRFVPPGALTRAEDALGLEPVADLPPGSYLVRPALRPPRPPASATPGLGAGRRPVEISVSGVDALAISAGSTARSLVDVVVTTEPRGVGPGRTYVAAAAVPLVSFGPGPEGPGPGTISSAVLGLTRTQALTLVAAENFARQVTLLPRAARVSGGRR